MYVFKEMQAEIDKRTVTIDELQREIEKGLAAKADLPKLEEDIKNLELDLDRLRKILPTNRETRRSSSGSSSSPSAGASV